MVGLSRLAFMVAVSGAISGCGGCEDETVERARSFLENHKSCERDPDCVVVSGFCGELPGGTCGRVTMNRQGRDSVEWKELETELGECSGDCAQCDIGIIPTCMSGSCSP